jgi:hypothetical protein
MPLELHDDAKVAIELYVKQLNTQNEEQRQKRVVLYATIIGIFTAAFTGVIVGLLAWALNSITSGTHGAAVEAAKQETARLLQSPPILQAINSTTERANDAALKATQSAAEARVEATEADVSLKTLRTTIASTTTVASALQDVNNFEHNIANDPEFQRAVVNKLTEIISAKLDDINQLKLRLTELTKPSTLSIVTVNRALGQVFTNMTGKTMIIIVTAFNNARGNTMCGNVAKSTNELPAGTSGSNSTTTVQSSFIDDKFSASIAFAVPAGYFYNVTTDGGAEKLQTWTEVIL